MKLPKKLGDLWDRQEELRRLIDSYQDELVEIEKRISSITGQSSVSYDQIYDDQNPDYIRNTEDGI